MALSIIDKGAAAATSITLTTQASGDICIFWAYRDGNTTAPTIPTAGGTVPTWNTIDAPAGSNLNSAACCWALMTGSSTSGTWTNATGVAYIILRGQHATPIGGHAQNASGAASSGGNLAVPAITQSDTSGAAVLVNFAGWRTVTGWSAPPAGYTQQAQVATECEVVTKDSSTSDGTFNLSGTASGNGGYRTQQVEVLAAAVSASIPAVVSSPQQPTGWFW